VLLPSGKTSFREVVEHPPAVCILVENGCGEILFVRQHRYPVGRAVLELPAGVVEPGEDPLETAHRELREEVGVDARSMREIIRFYTSPGFCDEEIILFFARDLFAAPLEGDDDETIQVESWNREALLRGLKDREFQDGKTLMALYWYLLKGEEILS
jgi:ADP-ribose pyrophosphatase